MIKSCYNVSESVIREDIFRNLRKTALVSREYITIGFILLLSLYFMSFHACSEIMRTLSLKKQI